ncbi:hypothetical protein JG688_00016643 [Phytophthora aleatoria]|uniref:Uncharacterized protein n=1 Tax=Phytophthora aleatoria TaxID=2496075 RepID=A0A8J5ITS9_9STRA|nr:hypothetical protein JG688_00016643 [Phytophthora aleatoria]
MKRKLVVGVQGPVKRPVVRPRKRHVSTSKHTSILRFLKSVSAVDGATNDTAVRAPTESTSDKTNTPEPVCSDNRSKVASSKRARAATTTTETKCTSKSKNKVKTT